MLPPEALRMLEYLRTRAARLSAAELRARVRAAAAELEGALDGVGEPAARRRPGEGAWSLATVVDHVAQSTVRAAEELRHLLAGRRPPGPPVYEGLTSGAAARLSWDELRADLREANRAFDAVLAAAGDGPPAPGVTARAVLVAAASDPAAAEGEASGAGPAGEAAETVFIAELDWKAYALVQRLHLLDHRTQVKRLLARP